MQWAKAGSYNRWNWERKPLHQVNRLVASLLDHIVQKIVHGGLDKRLQRLSILWGKKLRHHTPVRNVIRT